MRIFSLIAVALIMSSLTAPARAGMVGDCEQEYDRDLLIGGRGFKSSSARQSFQLVSRDQLKLFSFQGNIQGNTGPRDRELRRQPRRAGEQRR